MLVSLLNYYQSSSCFPFCLYLLKKWDLCVLKFQKSWVWLVASSCVLPVLLATSIYCKLMRFNRPSQSDFSVRIHHRCYFVLPLQPCPHQDIKQWTETRLSYQATTSKNKGLKKAVFTDISTICVNTDQLSSTFKKFMYKSHFLWLCLLFHLRIVVTEIQVASVTIFVISGFEGQQCGPKW